MDAPETMGPGREVGPFRIIRLLGRGGMGVVWLARDQRLGRRVALKVIEPDRLASPGARERFRREAAATAQLSHANVVTLYEVGELDGTPWVALEYIDGATLRARLEDDAPPLREAISIGHAIADALAAAHRAGILHRDLKPSNIILGRDGRPRVVDFGLARRIDDPTGTTDPDDPDRALLGPIDNSAAVGTPRYMSPEQWRREDATTACDVWALGLVLFELVHGRHPFDGLDRKSLRVEVEADRPVPPPTSPRAVSPALHDLIMQCLAKAAASRPSADAVEAALARLLERASVSNDESDSPYRGLMAFGERHADAFFGRDAETAAFLERLRDEPMLPVVGPSGAGKSSFVQAGVVPRLRERGWAILHVRPGRRPMAALAQRLVLGELPSGASPGTAAMATGSTVTAEAMPREAMPRERPGTEADDLEARLSAEPAVLGVELRAWAEAQRVRVLLFVDQLEELYAGVVADDERRAFLRALALAADDHADPVRVVVTLRDDFLGRVAEVDEIRTALSRVTVLRSPGVEALRDILIRPAERAGYRWDDGLVDDMVAQVAAAPAGLPLLAFTARQVWHRRDRDARRLTRASYDEIGGVAGALAVHADGVIAGLSDGDERVVRDLLLRLVSAENTRRVVAHSDLLDGLPASADGLLHRLVEARLITTRRSFAADGGAEVELAHESLIRSWDRLNRWIDEGRDDRVFVDHAIRAAALWREHGRRADDLWHGEALADARRILGRRRDRVPADVASLLAASERAATRTRRRRRGFALLGAAVLATIAMIAVVVAYRIAREERRGRHRYAEAQREAARAALSSGDVLAARARLRSSLEVEDSVLSRALWLRLAAEPLVWVQHGAGAVYGVALAPDRAMIAAVGQDGALRLIDRVTLETRSLDGGGDQLFAVGYSGDGRWVAAGSWSGEVSLWDVATAQRRSLVGHRGVVNATVFRGDELVTVCEDGTLRIWDVVEGQGRAEWTDGGAAIADVAIAADGTLVTASWDGAIRRWDRTGKATVIGRHDGAATSVAIAGDDVISGGRDGTVRLWPAGSRTIATGGHILGRVEGQVSRVMFDVARGRVMAASTSGPIHQWDLATGREAQPLRGHEGDPHGLAIDGDVLVSGGADETIRLWDLAVPATRPPPGHSRTAVSVDISRDGATAISGGYDHEARRWDVATGVSTGILRGHRDRIYAVRLLPDGRAVTASADGTLRLWEGTGAVAVAPLALAGGAFYDVGISDDGRLIAAGATDGQAHLWNPDTGAVRAIPVAVGVTVDGLALDHDGRTLATGGSDAVIRIFDVATGTLRRELRGHTATVPGLAFSDDGRQLASCDEDGAVWLWDLPSGDGRVLWKGARTYRVSFQPRGTLIGVASADGVARLLDRRGVAAPRQLRGHLDEVNEIRFSGDGAIAVTVSNDLTVRAWDVATGAPRWHADPHDPPRIAPGVPPPGFEEVPPSPVLATAAGPAGTVAIGFASGVVGLWDPASGQLLHQLRLHGPVAALAIEGDALEAISELGDRVALDLSALATPYCELLRQVWASVPITLDGVQPVRAPIPRDHRCAP